MYFLKSAIILSHTLFIKIIFSYQTTYRPKTLTHIYVHLPLFRHIKRCSQLHKN